MRNSRINTKEESYECSDLCPIFGDRQREESIEGQLRECTDYALKNNLTLLGTYVDRAHLQERQTDRTFSE